MKRFSLFIFGLVLTIFLSVASVMIGEAKNLESIATAMPNFITLKGGTTPNSPYDLVARAILHNVESAFPKVRVRIIPGGTKDGVTRVQANQADLGTTITTEAYMGFYGLGKQYPEPAKNIRTMLTWPLNGLGCTFIVLKDSPIKSISQLGNKRIGVGPPGSGGARFWVPAALKVNNITYDSIKENGGLVYYGNYNNMFELLASGRLDAVFFSGIHPYAVLTSLNTLRSIRFIKFTSAELANMVESYYGGLKKATIPANTYAGQTEPVPTVTMWCCVAVRKNMPDDVVYNLLWSIYRDDGKALQECFPPWREVDFVSNGITGALIPIHTGALRYWKERGEKIPKLPPAPSR